MNYINYIKHISYQPETLFRRWDFDLPPIETVQRIGTAALPFIAMYSPAGSVLSLAANTSRLATHLQSALEHEQKKEWKATALETSKAALAALALSACFFHLPSALILTTGFDVAQGLYNTWQTQDKQEGLQTVSSACYLSFLTTGSLEAMLAFSLTQTVTAALQAKEQFDQERFIEAFGKIALGALRLNQSKNTFASIQRRNILASHALFMRALKGKAAAHLIHHPLADLQIKIENKEVVFLDGKGNPISLGSHFHGTGGAIVKGDNLAFRTKDGYLELDFEINHAFRKELEASIEQLRSLNAKQTAEILRLAGSHATGISVTEAQLPNTYIAAHKISLQGIGNIFVGSENLPNTYNRVILQIPETETLFALHEALCLLNLDQALCLSTPEDIERLKLGHLFRTFFPKEAFSLERSKEFFRLSIPALKAKMFALAPDFQQTYATYFDKMTPDSIVAGRVRYRINGLAEAAYEAGARALTSAITGAWTDEELFLRVASMIRSGMLSKEMRDSSGVEQGGLGGFDYHTGGADSVFTQLLTENNCKENLDLGQLYHSKVRLLISLEALELGSYQYHSDSFGNRLSQTGGWWWGWDDYANRDNILDFIRQEQEFYETRNEVMLKERLDPSFFKGILLSDELTKTKLIHYLNNQGLIQNGCILNIPLHAFLRVGTHASEELLR